ncbi:hypothetical protein K5I29_02155 [Flavobacterium agricola]|uniref:Secreted protein n=1 Tax=Flavobacterium agricola TaxID=2870839 RepID=A0ABY6M281_9FLAO|nr:hypothetical protein [Flavobacterium agricola]UYW01749.1 hypothetical protein K5I29_02155 [Flavobacterium agricola]
MKKLLLLLISCCGTLAGWAQKDNNATSVIIPKAMDRDQNVSKSPAIRFEKTETKSKFNPIEFEPIEVKSQYKIEKPNSGYLIGDKDKNKFNQDEKFTMPYQLQRDIVVKSNINEDDSKVFRRNQSFGELRTTANSVKLMFKDYAAVDGDRIKIMVNGLTVRADVSLIEVYQTVEIGLTPGFNKVEFEALNQGYSGPNTAQFKIVDDTGKQMLENRWDLATGFKASILIIKE